MRVNYGENRIANTETDKFIREMVGGGGTISRLYLAQTGRYYLHVTSSLNKPTIAFIRDREAQKIIDAK